MTMQGRFGRFLIPRLGEQVRRVRRDPGKRTVTFEETFESDWSIGIFVPRPQFAEMFEGWFPPGNYEMLWAENFEADWFEVATFPAALLTEIFEAGWFEDLVFSAPLLVEGFEDGGW